MLTDQRKGLGRKRKTAKTWQQLGDCKIAGSGPQPLTLIQSRIIETRGRLADAPDDITYQHSVLCQIGLPYRDPGADVRDWKRRQGNASLLLQAGEACDPETGDWVKLGLPWGPKARLIMMHLNSEAIRTRSPEIDVGDSLTDFVKRIGLTTDGRTIRTIKAQVGALSAALIRMAFIGSEGAYQIDTKVVSGFDLWLPKDEQQRVLWPSTVKLSADYFESLQRHAVPLDERAVGALSHSAMALDVYAWLAQRLHRIPKGGRHFIAWALLHEQFGPDFTRIRKFRETFMDALRQVYAVYPSLKIDVTKEGLFLYPSAPPVTKTKVAGKALTKS